MPNVYTMIRRGLLTLAAAMALAVAPGRATSAAPEATANGAAAPAAPATTADDKDTTKPRDGAETFSFGALGQDFTLQVEPLRGRKNTASMVFDEKSKSLEEMSFEGFIKLTTEDMLLECESLNFDGKKLVARYNVFLRQPKQSLRATCGQLSYDVATQTIELEINPVITRGTVSTSDMEKVIITRTKDGKMRVQTIGSTKVLGKSEPQGTKPNDKPTTAAKEIELSPGGLDALKDNKSEQGDDKKPRTKK